MTAHGLLMDGTKREGKIRYISPAAEKSTRTFKVELEISNEGNKVAEGTTAELVIPLKPRAAHRISASFFFLTSNGDLGIKVVDQSDTVNFLPVKILGGSDKEIIVGGLPKNYVSLPLDTALLNLEIKSRLLKRIDSRVSRRGVELST